MLGVQPELDREEEVVAGATGVGAVVVAGTVAVTPDAVHCAFTLSVLATLVVIIGVVIVE